MAGSLRLPAGPPRAYPEQESQPANQRQEPMTEYVVTYVGEPGQRALALSVALGNDEQARQFASRTAQRCHGVTLTTVDEDGAVATMARWLDGILTRSPNGNSAVDANTAFANLRDAAEDFVAATEDSDETADDDSSHHFDGYCVKCKTNREFVGRVVELKNGSHQAKGACPVCGTNIGRMVARTTPLDEDEWEEPSPEDVEAENATPPVTDPETGDVLDEEIQSAVSEAIPEGTPVEQVAAATANLAAEFSNAVDEAEAHEDIPENLRDKEPAKASPAKKAGGRKAKRDANGKTPNQRAAANPRKAKCPQCDQSVDVIERAGIGIFTVHPDEAKGLDRCPGSTTVVSD